MHGSIQIFKGLYLSSLIVFFMVIHTSAASAAGVSECSVKDASENVVVIVCPPGLKDDEFRTVGEKACLLDNGICNVWIWDNAKKAPNIAPEQDIDLSKKQIREATAIWANKEQKLVVLRKVKQ